MAYNTHFTAVWYGIILRLSDISFYRCVVWHHFKTVVLSHFTAVWYTILHLCGMVPFYSCVLQLTDSILEMDPDLI